MFNLYRKQPQKQHSMLFPMLLWFIPIIVLNSGLWFINLIDHYHKEEKQKEAVNIELRSMTSASEFNFQFSKYARVFMNILSSIANSEHNNFLEQTIPTEAKKIFAPPFPDYDLYVFYMPCATASSQLIYTNKELKHKRQACMSFDYLVSIDSKNTTKLKNTFIKSFMHTSIDPDFYAYVKGLLTYSLYNMESHKFIWNYVTNNRNEIYGYFIFCKNTSLYNENSRKIILNDAKKETINPDNPLYGCIKAYIPFFKNYKDIFGNSEWQNDSISTSKLFNKEIDKILPKSINDIYNYQIKGYINEIKVGKYKAYTYLGKEQTHLSLILVPYNNKFITPTWLYIINIIYISTILLIILRGLIFNIWPIISLKHRFKMCFILSAIFPLSILGITFYSYLLQSKTTGIQKQLDELQKSIDEFDIFHEQFTRNNASLFRLKAKNNELIKLLKTEQNASNDNIKEKLTELFFYKNYLPFNEVYLVDQNAIGCMLLTNKSTIQSKELDNETSINEFVQTICRSLGRTKAKIKDDKKYESILKKGFVESYIDRLRKSTDDKKIDVIDNIRKQKGDYIEFDSDNGKKSIVIFDYIIIDGFPEYALIQSWSNETIESHAFNQTINKLGYTKPNYAFMAFKNNINGLEEIKSQTEIKLPHINKKQTNKIIDKARKLAQDSSFQHKKIISSYNDNFYLISYPARTFNNYIIVGICNMEIISQTIFNKNIVLLIIILLSFAIVLICNYIASKITLNPINTLKLTLDKVKKGNNNLSIISTGKDELSILCNEFSNMTKGLREREVLSTLISDQAMYAISSSSGSLETETFNGVALVTDIRNFTGTCEANDPKLITDLLNKHFAEMTAIISNYGGRIYKYIGDAIEAVFPEDSNLKESSSKRSVIAATLMLNKLAEINNERKKQGLFTYRIGIGLKYGTFYSGAIGSLETRIDYAILGEPLKKAAKLEALSINNPSFPLIIDDHIKQELDNNSEYIFKPINNETLDVYTIDKSHTTFNNSDKTTSIKARKKAYNHESIYANSDLGFLSTKIGYIVNVFIIALIAIFLYSCYYYANKTKRDYLIAKQANQNNIIFDQIKSTKTSEALNFEYTCRKGIATLQSHLYNNNKIEDLIPEINNFVNNNKIERYYIFYNQKKYKYNFESKLLAIQQNSHKNELHHLEFLAFKALLFHQENPDEVKTKNRFDDKRANAFIAEIYRTKDNNIHITKEKPISNEYIYWDFLYGKNKNGKIIPLGFIILTQNNNNKVSIQSFANSFTYEPNTFVAIKPDKEEKWYYSDNYINELPPIIINNKPNNKDYIINENLSEDFKFYDQNNKLIVATLKENFEKKDFIINLLLISIFIFLSIFLWNLTNKKSLINNSLSSKLQLAIFSVAIIPICALLIIFELYAIEKENKSIRTYQKEIQDFTDDFENRSFMTTPLAIKKIESKAKDKVLQKLITEYSRINELENNKEKLNNIENKIKDRLKYTTIKTSTFFEDNIKDNNEKYFYSNYRLDDTIISNQNWDFGFHHYGTDGDSNSLDQLYKEFGYIISSTIFHTKKTTSEKDKIKNIAHGTKTEEGLKILMGLFGKESYLKMPHFLSEPNKLNILNRKSVSYIQVFPNFKNPLCLITWILIFDNNQLDYIANYYNQSITKQNKIGYLVKLYNALINNNNQIINYIRLIEFSFYGHVNIYLDNPYFNSQMKQYFSNKSNNNTNVSGFTKINNKNILYNIKNSSDFNTLSIFTSKDLTPLYLTIKLQRLVFYIIILITILFSFISSKNITKDIIYPIKLLTNGMSQIEKENYSFRINLERQDELGSLCEAFNSMIKGLEEKELMKKMVSSTAQKVTLSEQTDLSKKTECILMYISVPDFNEYMKTLSPNIVLSDLQKHVEYIAKAINHEGGEIDKIMAEKQLIAFHTENRNKNDCIKAACKAAKSIIELEQQNMLPFSIAIGISCGTVVTGFLGVGDKRDFTVIGDPVNVAARIAAYGEKQETNKYLVSEEIYSIAKTTIKGDYAGEISLKGKSQPMKLYSIS